MSPHHTHDDDAGVTLVELIIYIVISGLFVGLLAGMFIAGLQAQERTTARDRATGLANVISASLQSSIRNATAFAVDGEGLRVDAVVITAEGAFECRAWAVDGGGELRYSTGVGDRSDDIGDWGTLASGASGTLEDGAAFDADGARGLDIGISIAVGDVTVPITNGVTAQAVATGGETCW